MGRRDWQWWLADRVIWFAAGVSSALLVIRSLDLCVRWFWLWL